MTNENSTRLNPLGVAWDAWLTERAGRALVAQRQRLRLAALVRYAREHSPLYAETLNAQPAWAALLGAWERLWTVPIQVAFSVVVLQVFRRGKLVWLLWAILGHAFVDLVAVGLQQILGPGLTSSLLIEVVVAVFGLMAIWIIWRLRDPPVQPVSSITLQPMPQMAGV